MFNLPGSFREMGAFYFKIGNRRDIHSTTLLIRKTEDKEDLDSIPFSNQIK